ncbi:MAG: hypothetical protein QOD28_510 [Acidobacteriota bacterium]|nr:hypothetical protein [Acidobacteriota bacterium]
MSSNLDGVVIALKDFVWAANQYHVNRLILGLPDIVEWANAKSEIAVQIESLSIQPVIVKLGFGVDDIKNISTEVLDNIKEIIAALSEELKWIIEPYFATSLDLTSRVKFLQLISQHPQVIALKLDLDNPKGFASSYTKSADNKPWFARSDGMTYSEFCERFKIAVQSGCVGAIVGAAIWSSIAHEVIVSGTSETARKIIHARIKEVQGLITSNI